MEILYLSDLYRSFLLLSLNHLWEIDCHLLEYGYIGTLMTKTDTDDRSLSLTYFHYTEWTVYNQYIRIHLEKL